MTWRLDQIASEGFVEDETDDPVVTVEFQTPAGMIKFMAEADERGSTLCLRKAHIEGPGANEVGVSNLRVLAAYVMEGMGYDEIEVEGASRTTGANPGRTPRPLRFTCRPRPAPEQ